MMRLHLFGDIFTMEARKLLSYRIDFWVSTLLGVAVALIIPYYLWSSIFADAETPTVAGYTFPAMLAYYVSVTLVGRAVRGPDIAQTLSTDIYDGGLTRYLIYPTSYLPFKYAQHLGACVPGFLQYAVLGTLFLLLWGLQAEGGHSAVSLFRGTISVAIANVLYFVIGYPIQGIAFWADNVWSLAVLMRFVSGLLGGFYLPLSLFPEWLTPTLNLLPFHHLYSFPVRVLAGEIGWQEWGWQSVLALGWCWVFVAIGTRVWRRGEHSYTGVGI